MSKGANAVIGYLLTELKSALKRYGVGVAQPAIKKIKTRSILMPARADGGKRPIWQ